MKRTARFLFRAIFPKNKFFLLLTLFLVGWVVVTPIFTQGQEALPISNAYTQQYAPEVPHDENTALQIRLINVLSAISCQISGVNPAYPNRPCIGIDSVTEKISFLPKTENQTSGGAIGFVSSMMGVMYDAPAASTHDYLAYLGDNFGIAKKAHAQGVGFTSLSPILPLWTASRNVAYLFYILAFIIIGILIMIRVRIDPRTVMTIQNQIPKIVVGIILITFSYAIAGFLIDFMYVTTYVLSNIVASTDPQMADTNFGGELIRKTNPISAASFVADPNNDNTSLVPGFVSFASLPADEVGQFVGGLFDGDKGRILTAITIGLISQFLVAPAAQAIPVIGILAGAVGAAVFTIATGGFGLPVLAALGAGALGGLKIGEAFSAVAPFAVGTIAGGFFGADLLAGIGKLFGYIIIIVAILSSLIRLWFSMMKAYILILIIIIMSPFYILFGLIPGASMSFSTWLRALLANLSIFPVTITMFMLARAIMDGIAAVPDKATIFVPPMVGNANIAGLLQAIVGLTFILLTPSVVDIMRAIFQSKTSPYTAGIGAAGAVGAGFAGGMITNPLKIMTQAKEVHMTPDGEGGVKYGDTGHWRALRNKALGGR